MSYRVLLPTDVVPEQYNLHLEPDLTQFTFDGTVKVQCIVNVATDVVTLHARDLAVWDGTFTSADGQSMDATGLSVNRKNQTVTLTFNEPLPTGKGVLEVKFKGTLNDQMAGFYRSPYTRADGQKAIMAVTQFEAIDARRCFPCWDEPGQKAVFVISMVVPRDLMAISNMPQSKLEYLPGGKKQVTFLPTPKMSTYLLALLVGELEAIQGITAQGTLIQVLAVPGRAAQCQYALTVGIRALEFYNDFFGVPFPLPKLDMVAIPDFASGAMENWGLVTYRETTLLCDETTVSTRQKQNIAACITHELAHQWFGNLVTMRWWDDLWLNEGFANWCETFCVDILTPEWKMWEIFVSQDQQQALQLDALRSSHPIQVPIANASEVEEVFDSISYAKGGSLVRMLFAVLGKEKFQAGLRIYFKRFAYSNTETADLAQAWEEASGMPIPGLVKSWTEKMGFPVLQVLKDPFDNEGTLEVKQQWFLADGSSEPSDDAVTWTIPMLLGSDGPDVPNGVMFFDSKTHAWQVPVAGAQWLKLNYGQHIPCRVLYTPTMLQRLSTHLSSLPPEDRIGMLSDMYALCKSGKADPTQLVDLLKGFGSEDNDKVWAQLSIVLRALDRIITMGLGSTVASAFQSFAAGLVRPLATKLGWEHHPTDSENTKKLRQFLVVLLANFCSHEPEVKEEAAKRLSLLLNKVAGAVSNDIRCSVMRIAIRNDDTPATYDKLVQLHNSTEDADLRDDIYAALGWVPPALHSRALEWCLSSDVKAQDTTNIPFFIAMISAAGQDSVFEWVKSQYRRIDTKLGKTSMMLFSDVVRSSGDSFVIPEKAAEVRAFWQSQSVYDAVKRTVSQTCETIETNAQFVARLSASRINDEEYWKGH